MKRSTRFAPAWLATTVAIAGLAGSTAFANQFTGSLAFSAAGVTTDNTDLADATSFSLTGAFTTSESGIYSTLGVTDFHPVVFNGFNINPAASSVTPLWTFNIGATVFTFDATSVVSTWVPGVGGGEWVVTGNGEASITGYDDTPGTWTVNLSDSGNLSLGFDSTSDAHPINRNVPDGGYSVTLLGSALTALGICARRKVSC